MGMEQEHQRRGDENEEGGREGERGDYISDRGRGSSSHLFGLPNNLPYPGRRHLASGSRLTAPVDGY